MEKTKCVIETGSFLCWIPYRWTDILVLDKVFSDSYDNIGRNQASVRYIRDNGSDGSDDDDDGDNESDDDSGTSEHRDRFLAKLSAEWKAQCHPEMVVEPEPKLLALWNAFRNIPREHFSDVMQRSQSPGFSSIALGTRGRGSSLSETPRRLSLRKRDFARGFWRMIFDPTVYYGLELTEAPERSGGMLTHV